MFQNLKKGDKKQEREGADFNSEDSAYFEHDVSMKMVCANPRFVTYRCESYYDLNSYNHGDEDLNVSHSLSKMASAGAGTSSPVKGRKADQTLQTRAEKIFRG